MSDNKREQFLSVSNLSKEFVIKRSVRQKNKVTLQAVKNVSFSLNKGEIFGLVGESGCGKSTLGRCVLQLIKPTSGEVFFKGIDVTKCKGDELKALRQKMQIVFQDPYASLNPRQTVFEAVMTPLEVFHLGTYEERKAKVVDMLKKVGISESHFYKFPHEMSGGQRQRVVIARALILQPEIVVCDEAVSALDVSVRSQVLNLFKDLQKQMDLTYLFISHDLSVIRYICDRLAVMYLGRFVEIGTVEEIFGNPKHPYTKALLSAIPVPDVNSKREYIPLEGEVPSPINAPKGCHFHPRCPYATEKCSSEQPVFENVNENQKVACFHWKDI